MTPPSARSEADWPLVSVVIPAYNAGDSLRDCVICIAKLEYPRTCLEVIVVDNGSTDAPVDLASVAPGLDIRVLLESRRGSYAARNAGIAASRGQLIAFIDADCRPVPGWLSAGVDYLAQHADRCSVGGPVEVLPSGRRRPSFSELYDRAFAFPVRGYIECEHYCVTANMLVARYVFERVGHFEASLLSGGDLEFGQRLRQHGLSLGFCEGMVVRHLLRTSMRAQIRKRRRIAGGHWQLAQAGLMPAQTRRPKDVRRHGLSRGQLGIARGVALWLKCVGVAEKIRLRYLGGRPLR